jgi:hypothetical protein
MRPNHTLEVLIIHNLSVETFTMFRHDSVVTRLRYYFLPLDWLSSQAFICWSVWFGTQALAHMLRALSQILSTTHIEEDELESL